MKITLYRKDGKTQTQRTLELIAALEAMKTEIQRLVRLYRIAGGIVRVRSSVPADYLGLYWCSTGVSYKIFTT